MSDKPSVVKVVMTKRVASRFLENRSRLEYRLKIFKGCSNIRNFPSLLRSFRDGRVKIGSLDPIYDLGISEGFDYVTVWSSNHLALKQLSDWAEQKGMETSGVL